MSENNAVQGESSSLVETGKEALGYTIVVILAFISGLASHVSYRGQVLFDIELVVRLVKSSGWFAAGLALYAFSWFFMRALILDPKSARDDRGDWHRVIWILCCAIGIIALAVAFFTAPWTYEIAALVFAILVFVAVPWVTIALAGFGESDPSEHFTWKTFYPALSVLMAYFLIGWSVYQSSAEAVLGQFLFIVMFSVLYWRVKEKKTKNVPKLVALNFGLVVVFSMGSALLRQISESLYRPEIGMAFLWTMTLGVFEVAKQPSIFSRNAELANAKEFLRFYANGANWSILVFLHLSVFFLFLYESPIIIIYIVLCISLSLIWTLREKKNELRRGVRMAGFFMPIAFVVLLAIGQDYFPAWVADGYQQYAGTIATILAMVVTVFFVIYAGAYTEFPDFYAKNELFISRQNCVMLVPLIIIACMVSLFAFVSFYQVAYGSINPILSRKLDAVLTIYLIEMVVIFAAVLWLPHKDLDGDDPGNQFGARGGEPAAASGQSRMSSSRAFAKMARPVTSALAGLLCFAAYWSSADELTSDYAASAFLLGATLCMFGFVVNDLFDYGKDRSSQRVDKVLVTGELTSEHALSFALLLLTVSIGLAARLPAQTLPAVSLAAAALVGYSPFARSVPLLKGLYTGVLTASPFVIGFQIANAPVPLFFLSLIIVFICGREILIDLDDIRHDIAVGMMTIPTKIGANLSLITGWTVMSVSLALGYFGFSSDVSQKLMAVAALGTLVLGIVTRHQRLSFGIDFSRVPMLLVVVALVTDR